MRHDVQQVLMRLATATMSVLELEGMRYADPGERNVVSELFVRLRAEFPDWDVSNEYDRREQVKKRLAYDNPATGAMLEADITPDIIVHRIGVRENLLVVEVKRHVNTDMERDIWKLSGMTAARGAYGYAIGVHLILNIPAGIVVECNVYIDGAIDIAHTTWLRERLPSST